MQAIILRKVNLNTKDSMVRKNPNAHNEGNKEEMKWQRSPT
ncbi:MAG: hypothetical protein PWQ88_131 [Candidatus Methanomethylophilaceae archaeon]|nr:hypothetical protein [Candidatus Methanomethylophilaceae archaeon]